VFQNRLGEAMHGFAPPAAFYAQVHAWRAAVRALPPGTSIAVHPTSWRQRDACGTQTAAGVVDAATKPARLVGVEQRDLSR